MIPKIKTCGMTREADVRLAAALGVDAIGFIFAESPRKVAPGVVQTLSKFLSPFVSTVGVFVDADPDYVRQIATTCSLDWVQLHGEESPSYCRNLGLNILKAIRVKDRESIENMATYKDCVRGFVLDTYVKGQKGGTGKTFDWSLAREAKRWGPVILAGGLTPHEVQKAVTEVAPYGLDVNSGIESAPGIKDHDKMRRFVEEVRACVRDRP
jgi:phosphoribosylanthranilate isomerase